MNSATILMEPVPTGNRVGRFFGKPVMRAKTVKNRVYEFIQFTFFEEAVEYMGVEHGDRVMIYKGVGAEEWYISLIDDGSDMKASVMLQNGRCLHFISRHHWRKGFTEGYYVIGKIFLEETTQRCWYPLTYFQGLCT
jgi:hypothetical protein